MQSGSVHLRHDPDAAVVVTEVLQLYVSICGAVDTAIVAYLTAFGVEDTAFFGAWHGGHGLWSLARWTQPLEPGRQPLEVPLGRSALCCCCRWKGWGQAV